MINTIFNLFVCDTMLNSIDKHDYDYLYFLLDYYSPLDCSSAPPLKFIYSLNHKYIIKALSTSCENSLTSNRESMLHVAVKNNDIRVVRFLLEKGLDPSVKGCLIIKNKVFNDITPLHLAVFYGFDDIARILIEAGANINDGCYNIIEPNTMNRGNIGNEVTLYNLTPLHLACLKGDRNLMELLLSNNGICSNFCIIDGKSILEEGNIMHLAAVKAHRKIIDFIQKENLISNKNG